MKKHIHIFLVAVVLFMSACSGSSVYQGNWKATDMEGNKFDITFEPKSFEIKDTTGNVVKYTYTQNSVEIANSVTKYGIQLGDGRTFNLLFPFENDTSKAIIMLENNDPVYTISRNSYIEYKDIYKLTE